MTIADYDRVIVMKRGKIIEEGKPHFLIESDGHFADMVNESGHDADAIKAKARKSFLQIRK